MERKANLVWPILFIACMVMYIFKKPLGENLYFMGLLIVSCVAIGAFLFIKKVKIFSKRHDFILILTSTIITISLFITLSKLNGKHTTLVVAVYLLLTLAIVYYRKKGGINKV